MHESNCFVTLTYDAEHLSGPSLHYPDFQRFLKRLRRRSSSAVRFYMAGEYGELNARPHYHALLFGFDFLDKLYIGKSPGGSKLYRSSMLEDLWPFGFSSVGDVNFESAAYVARYCMKKVTGEAAVKHYEVIDEDGVVSSRSPEFNRMSLKPGVGANWFKRFQSDVYPHGMVVVNGVECRPPRYYDKLFERDDGVEYGLLQFRRDLEARALAHDNTPERLEVKRKVVEARVGRLLKKL